MGTDTPPMRCSNARATGVLLLLQRGHDALRIAYQARSSTSSLRRSSCPSSSMSASSRSTSGAVDGCVERLLISPSPILMQAKADGIDAVAIVFMHAESIQSTSAVAAVCRKCGFTQAPSATRFKPLLLVGRGDTTGGRCLIRRRRSRYSQPGGGRTGAHFFPLWEGRTAKPHVG